MRAMSSELSLYKSQVSEYKFEIEGLKDELITFEQFDDEFIEITITEFKDGMLSSIAVKLIELKAVIAGLDLLLNEEYN